MTIVFAILLFSVLIFVHELGHFVAAKLSGVQVNEFSMFMGPAIAKWKRGETQYSIRCIPIGGYCAMEGEDVDTDSPKSFQKAAWWKRLIILVAGSFMNFVIGVVIVGIVLACQANYATAELAHIESWSTISQGNGLREGDKIVRFNGEKISIYEDLSLALMLLPDGQYDIEVERDGQRVLLEDVRMERQLIEDDQGNENLLYGFSPAIKETTFASAMERTLPTAFNHVKMVIVSLKMLLTGQAGLNDMTGAVGIVKIMSDSASEASTAMAGFVNLMWFGGFIAINLAVMNLLPVPALDGGRVVGLLLTTGIEKITRKKVNPKYEGYIHGAGMILLLAFMALITFKDIFTIFKG